MPWFLRLSRFGDAHAVYSQQEENSCGIASVMMCVFKVNKLTAGATAVHKEQEVYKIYSEVSGADYDGSGYSDAQLLDDALNRLNCGSWTCEYVGPDKVAQLLIDKCSTSLGPTLDCKPVILLLGWNANSRHFVVVDTVRNVAGAHFATVCDPYDGQLRVTAIAPGIGFGYETAQTAHLNFEGRPEHSYGSVKSGVANGWVVRQS